MNHRAIALLATCIAFVAASTSQVHATRMSAQAVAICQAALPAFEGQIRKRPLAIQNEGSADAFVTCAFVNSGPNSATHRISEGIVYLQNLGNETRTVSCTAVNSSADANPGSPLYTTKTVSVVPDSNNGTQLSFAAAEFPGNPMLLPGNTFSISCSLQPDIGITGTVLLNNAP